MKRREFLAVWKRVREANLREMYRNDPHGAACLAASLCEVEERGLQLWRKYRKTFSRTDFTEDQLIRSLEG